MKPYDSLSCLIVTLAFIFITSITAYAQSNHLTVTVNYKDTPLYLVLDDISSNFNIHFSYSKDNIEANRNIRFKAKNQPLSEVLKRLFDENNIVYTRIGDQIVLKPKKVATDSISSRSMQYQAPKQQQKNKEKSTPQQQIQEAITVIESPQVEEPKRNFEVVSIERRNASPLDLPSTEMPPANLPQPELQLPEADSSEPQSKSKTLEQILNVPEGHRIAQASVFPMLSTNLQNPDLTNYLSFNLFWGINGGLEGFELGIFSNSIKRDMLGMQTAGLFNTIGGNGYGLQAAGLLNMTAGNFDGIQAAGLWNTANRLRGLQAAGLINFTADTLLGLQAGGFGNIAMKSDHSIQLAGFMNYAKGNTKSQFAGGMNIITQEVWGIQAAGIFNYAQKVYGIQAAGALNYAKKVNGIQTGLINITKEMNGLQVGLINRNKTFRGLQVGLINIADSAQGLPVGFINIIKKNGYNKLELAASETMHANLAIKFGAKAFYSMIELGARREQDGLPNRYTFSAGYGLGSYLPFSKVLGLNLEVTSTLIGGYYFQGIGFVQTNSFTPSNYFNILNQARLTIDVAPFKGFSLFVGPTFNIMIDNQSLFDGNIFMWPGIRGGIRLF